MNRGMWTWLNVLALGVLAASCSASVKHDDGSVDLLVTGGASPTIARVVVSISGEGIPAPIARDVPRESKAWKQILGAIPTGAERTLHAVAIGADNQTIAVGHVDHVPIGGGRTTSVVLVLEPSSGVSGTAPRIDALVASMAASDETWTLRASAHDPDSAAQLSYSWSATLGAFDQPSASSTTWRASSAGLSVIRFVARDASGALAGLSLQLRAGQAPDGGGGGGSSSGGGASSSGGSGGGDSGAGGGGDGGTSSSGGAAGGIGEASVTATMNTWPIVDAVNATPTLIDVGATTALTTTASDPDGDPLTYAWSQGCVGSFDNATSPAPRFLLAAAPPAGICPLVVQVTDGRGGTNTGTFTIQTGAPPPVAFAPVIDSTFQSATTIAQNGVVTLRVRAHATDSSALVFDWSLVTGAYGARTTTANASETTWTAPAGFAGTTHLVATVRDSRGNVTPVDFAIAVATP